MANRQFSQFRYSLEKAVVDLYAKVAIGATGAPTLSRGKGIASISRTSAGLYVITLQDKYNALLHVSCAQIDGTVPMTAPVFNVVSETVGSTKLVTVQFTAATAAGDTTLVAADPDNGATLLIKITLSNSSAV